jgi:hypothetical protein
MTDFWIIFGLVVSNIIIMVGQADSGQGGILMFGIVLFIATILAGVALA